MQQTSVRNEILQSDRLQEMLQSLWEKPLLTLRLEEKPLALQTLDARVLTLERTITHVTPKDGPRGQKHACLSPTPAATPEHLSALSPSGSYPTILLFPLNHLETEQKDQNCCCAAGPETVFQTVAT